MPVGDVLRDLTEDVRNQVRFDRDENHVRAADHFGVAVSDGNPELLKSRGRNARHERGARLRRVGPARLDNYLEASQVPDGGSTHFNVPRKDVSFNESRTTVTCCYLR